MLNLNFLDSSTFLFSVGDFKRLTLLFLTEIVPLDRVLEKVLNLVDSE